MTNRLKWVEVEYKAKSVENQYFGKQVDSSDKMIELTDKVFENMGSDQTGIVCVNSKLEVINIFLMENFDFKEYQKESLAKVILNNAAGAVIISNNDYISKTVGDVAAMLQYAGIQPLDYIINNEDEYISLAKNGTEFINNYQQIRLNPYYDLDYKDIKKASKLKLNTTKYGKATDDVLSDAIRDITEKLSKSEREKLVVMSLDDDLNYINSSVVSIGDLTSSIANPREILKVPLLSNAKNFMLFHNHPSGNNMPSEEDIGLTARVSNLAKMLGMNCIDSGIIGAFSDEILYIKGKGLLMDNKKKDIQKVVESKNSYITKKSNIVNIKVSKPYVLEGNANNGTELKIVMIPDGISVEGIDIGNYTFEPRTINQSDDIDVYNIPFKEDEKIKLKRGEEFIYITAGALADTSLIKDYSCIIDSETKYINYEDLSWSEYIEQFVSGNIEVLEGENISQKYFAEEFINCVEIPESDTMNFLDHFEPVVFNYLNSDNEKVDNFDLLKLNIIKSGINDFAKSHLTAQNGFIKVNKTLVSNLQEKFLKKDKEKSYSVEMEF